MDGASWGNLGSSKQLTTAKGKNEMKKREKLKKIERDIDTPGVAAAEGRFANEYANAALLL